MYTVQITQEVQCRDKSHAYDIWAGSEEYEGEAFDIRVFQNGEPMDDVEIQNEINRAREWARKHIQGFKEAFAP